MPAPTDRVQPLKQETTALGGQDADARDYPVPINPQQDAIEVMGVFLQDAANRDEAVYVTRVGNDVVLRDLNNTTELTLTQLRTGSASTQFRRMFLLMGG